MNMRTVRNARRTWPDGSGCDQRPLHPCQPGCPGWLRLAPSASGVVRVARCPRCRTFDDSEDAAAHVAHCPACLSLALAPVSPSSAPMPPRGRRRQLTRWCNSEFDDLELPRLHPDSHMKTIARWLEIAGFGTWLFEDAPTAWHTLAAQAPSDTFEDEYDPDDD